MAHCRWQCRVELFAEQCGTPSPSLLPSPQWPPLRSPTRRRRAASAARCSPRACLQVRRVSTKTSTAAAAVRVQRRPRPWVASQSAWPWHHASCSAAQDPPPPRRAAGRSRRRRIDFRGRKKRRGEEALGQRREGGGRGRGCSSPERTFRPLDVRVESSTHFMSSSSAPPPSERGRAGQCKARSRTPSSDGPTRRRHGWAGRQARLRRRSPAGLANTVAAAQTAVPRTTARRDRRALAGVVVAVSMRTPTTRRRPLPRRL